MAVDNMKTLYSICVLLGYISLGYSFTKYGRTCKDIGCPSNQECIMATDPCSYYQRQGECGSYPTCKRTGSGTARTCATFVCPPSQVCKIDGSNPRCVDDHSKSGLATYDTQAANAPLDPSSGSHQPSAPSGGSNLYPSVPRGETTARPNVYRPAVQPGGGYQGGQIGSGYPGQARPAYTGGYPQQAGGYPQQGNPQQGYPQGGNQNYPQGGYNQGGYQGGYQQQYPGYNPGYQNPNQQQNQYGQKSTGSSLTDKITQGLKTIGLFCALLSYFASSFYIA